MLENLIHDLYRLHWDTTGGCNSQCIICANNSGLPLQNELSTKQMFSLLEEAADLGVAYLRMLGGEPFFRKDIIHVMEKAASKNIQFTFSTNGSLITSEISEELYDLRPWILNAQISFYGLSPEEYQLYCGNGNLFAKSINGLENLTKIGLIPNIIWIITEYNRTRIGDMCDFAYNHGARSIRLAPVVSEGRALHTSFHLSKYDFYSSLKELLLIYQPKIPIEVMEFPLLGDFIRERLPVVVQSTKCNTALCEMYIAANGYSRPCPFQEITDGRITDTTNYSYPSFSLETIWKSLAFEQFRLLHDSIRKNHIHKHCSYLDNGECRPCPLSKTSCHEAISGLSGLFK